MNRYEYKGYWIEFFIENDELANSLNPFYFIAFVELLNQKGVVTLDDRYLTLFEAKQSVEKFIDMIYSFDDSEVIFESDYQEEFVFNQPEAWGSPDY